MFTQQEKQALDNVKRVQDIELSLWKLLEEVEGSIRRPKEIIDEYVDDMKRDLARRKERLEEERDYFDKTLKGNYEAIEALYQEKSQGFPWLAKAYADYSYLRDLQTADWMENKTHPAEKSAQVLRRTAQKRREAERKFRIVK